MKASEYLQFHPEGDVVLILRDKAHDGEEDFGSSSLCSHPSDTDDVCGHQQSREVHMCVSSMHLVQVSPVFRGLLRGGFKESHRLRSEGAIEIPLPGDDPSTFEILLNIIHGRLKRVPSRINIDQLTQVAILVDKYGLHEVSQWYTAAWIDCLKGSLPMSFTKELMPWICISWVFQEQVYIEKTTEIALWESEGDLCNTTEFSLPIPAFVLGAIDSAREVILFRCFHMLETLINKYQGSTQVCRRKDDCDAMVLGGLLKALKAKDLLPLPRPPFRGLSIKTLVGKLQELQLPTLCEKLGVESLGYISPTGFYRNDPGRCGVAQEILNTIIKMEESIKECTLGVQHLPKTKEES